MLFKQKKTQMLSKKIFTLCKISVNYEIGIAEHHYLPYSSNKIFNLKTSIENSFQDWLKHSPIQQQI